MSIAPSLGIPDLKYNDEKNEDKFLIENNERKHALQIKKHSVLILKKMLPV